MADEQQSMLKLNIKSTKRKDAIEVPTDCTVKQVILVSLVCKLASQNIAIHH